jgi:hypothetical protein
MEKESRQRETAAAERQTQELEGSARLASYACARCRRRCIAVGNGDALEPLRCICGGDLRVDQLPAGLYEIVGPVPPSSEVSENPSSKTEEAGPPLSQEADKGYGQSHGYGPGHGGPTGPGDAPAG